MTSTKPRRVMLASLVAVALALTPATAPSVAAVSGPPPQPADDPFYTTPNPLPDAPPGTVLRSRKVTVSAVGLPVPTDAWQVMFVSRNAKSEPVEGIATILVPKTPPAGGDRPLLSYQTAEDSLARHCAPSYTLRAGTEKELPLLGMGLAQGWAVVVTDYEGPRSQYGPGHQAGHATLDGVRAALNFEPAGLAADTKVGLWGYSGGGLATVWASELQPSYASELNLAGVAQGGVPPDLEAVARQIDGGMFSGIYFAVSVGLDRAYPEMDIESILNDAGRAMVEDIGGKCAGDIIAGYSFRSMSEFTTVDDPLELDRMRVVLATNHLGRHEPAGPVYSYHSINDQLIPIADVDELIAEYCAEGVPVSAYRDPASEHNSLAVTGAPSAVSYLADRFAGQPAPTTC